MRFPTVFHACILLVAVNAEELTSETIVAHDKRGATYCEYYNVSTCVDPQQDNCFSREECSPQEPDKRSHCYVLWEKNDDTGNTSLKFKGCFSDDKECYDKPQCVDSRTGEEESQFCCCDGNMCNQNYTSNPTQPPKRIIKLPNSSWVVTNGGCIVPEQPEGGNFKLGSCKGNCEVTSGSQVPIGSFLIYKCDKGYKREGNNISVCYNHEWILPPTCVKSSPCSSVGNRDSFGCESQGSWYLLGYQNPWFSFDVTGSFSVMGHVSANMKYYLEWIRNVGVTAAG